MVIARSFVRPVRLLLACGLSLTLLMACSGDDDTSPSTVALPSAPPTTEASPITSSSSQATTSPPQTTDLNPPPTITDPPTTTTTTVPLPPVSTLVPEVPADLLRPEQLDPNNANNSRPILPEHLPVIEAHLRLLQLGTKVSSTWPVDGDSPLLLEAPVTPENLLGIQEAARGRFARGEVLNVEQGVTFRPYVVGPVTDTATVMDCELAGHYWVKADTGELVPPTEVWAAGPGRIVEVGLRETWVLRDGQWLALEQVIDPSACA
jgi:hypothetical protein